MRTPLDRAAFLLVPTDSSTRMLAATAGRSIYVLERNGDVDRVIDPDDIEATETLATGYTTEAGGTEVTYPLVTDAEGKVSTAPWYEQGSYDVYIPEDELHPTTRWEALSGEVLEGSPEYIAVLTEAPLNVKFPEYGSAGEGASASDNAAAFLEAAQAADSGGGSDILIPPGTYSINAVDFSTLNGFRFRGSGTDATTLVVQGTTGTKFNLDGCSFCGFSDMLIRPSAQQTAGEFFKLDDTAGSCQGNRFRHLRIASPFKGWNLVDCTTLFIEDVQFLDTNAGWAPHSFIHMSGAVTSTTLQGLKGGTGAGIATAMVYIEGSTVDTIHGYDWDLLNLSATSAACLRIDGGEWMHFTDISLEAGTTTHALHIANAPKGMSFKGVHLLGYRGLYIAGGKNISVVGGEIIACQREGVLTEAYAAITDLKLSDLHITDCSQATDNTYDAIRIGSGTNDFSIRGCRAGGNGILGYANNVKYGLEVESSNDRYIVQGNRFTGDTGGLLDSGGGGTKVVADNI